MSGVTISKLQSKLQSSMEYLVTYGWALIIIAVVLAAMYELGFFNAASHQNNLCLLTADISCTYAQLSTTGQLLMTLQQSTAASINITAVGCNQNSTITNMEPFTGTNQIVMPAGSATNVTVSCYMAGNNIYVGSVGSVYTGFVIINYTEPGAIFPETVVGKLVQKTIQ